VRRTERIHGDASRDRDDRTVTDDRARHIDPGTITDTDGDAAPRAAAGRI
jgi:hypothetical protein